MGLMDLVSEMKKLDKELQKNGSSLEAVIKSLLDFGKDAPTIFKRLEDMENLISKLEILDDMAGQINNIESMLKEMRK